MSYKERLITDLRALGIEQGDVVLVHSSIRKLNAPCIDAIEIIEALIETIGEQGTLLVPALSYILDPNSVFDYRQTRHVSERYLKFFAQSITHRSIHQPIPCVQSVRWHIP